MGEQLYLPGFEPTATTALTLPPLRRITLGLREPPPPPDPQREEVAGILGMTSIGGWIGFMAWLLGHSDAYAYMPPDIWRVTLWGLVALVGVPALVAAMVALWPPHRAAPGP